MGIRGFYFIINNILKQSKYICIIKIPGGRLMVGRKIYITGTVASKTTE